LKEATPDKVYDTLSSASKVSKRCDLNVGELRPCIGKMMETPLFKGSFPQRNEACLVIASELRRVGKNEERVLEILRGWNWKNIDPLKESEVRSAMSTAFRKEYNYSCLNPNLKEFCVGDSCPFANYIKGKRKYFDNRMFLGYGWQNILSNVAKCVYCIALPELERRLGVGAGGLIIANQRRIAKWAGVSEKSVRKALKELVEVSLITYEPGLPRKWEGKASKIRRFIPIPKPSKKLLARREK
jgi:hypothetical protein